MNFGYTRYATMRGRIVHYSMAFLDHLQTATSGCSLSSEQAEGAMSAILLGEATPAQIAGFLVALKMKGETVDELVGFARAMRTHAAAVDVGDLADSLIDTCGTGGGGPGTFNISTVAAFVVAGAGVPVAKHGNRSVSEQGGSADVLESLGMRMALAPERIAACIREIGIGFLFAPALHPAMKHAAPVRRELKIRTVFNLLGPLTNPAGARIQLIGAPSPQAAELMAGALARLGAGRALVVHGSDGLDEITTTGPTTAFEVSDGEVKRREFQPADFGVPPARLSDLLGAGMEENCRIARAILGGQRGPQRDIVVVNAAAGLWLAGRAPSLADCVKLAERSIDSGAAQAKLELLIQRTQSQ